jgi:hypothetical protein
MQAKFNKSYLYLPIRVLVSFNLFTLFLFVFGPVNWKLDNEWIVVAYVLINLLFLYIGFKFGIKTYRKSDLIKTYDDNKSKVKLLMIIAFIWFLPALYIRLGIETFDINEIFNKIIEGFVNPAVGYQEKSAIFENRVGGRPFLKIFNFLIMSPITYAFFAISILYYKNFSKKIRYAIAIMFLLECLSWISIGTNKGLVDTFLFLFFMGIVVDPKFYQFNVKRVIVVLIAIAILLSFFISTMLSRFGIIEDSNLIDNIDFSVLGNPLKTTGIYAEMSMVVQFGLMQLTSYLAQGYYGLALTLQEPLTWTYGFGNSWMGLGLWEIITKEDLMPSTYLGLVEKRHGIDPNVAWHSIYPWLASDFTFVGVPFVIFAIGYFFSISWLDTIYKRTIYSNMVFCLFAQMIFYFYANNQIISFSIIPFITYIFLWSIFRRR